MRVDFVFVVGFCVWCVCVVVIRSSRKNWYFEGLDRIFILWMVEESEGDVYMKSSDHLQIYRISFTLFFLVSGIQKSRSKLKATR